MRIGTDKVRAALGDVSDFVTDEAIQEALWHYYYDVAKSVTYLKSMPNPQPFHDSKLMSSRPECSPASTAQREEAEARIQV